MWQNIWPGVPQDEVPIMHVTNGCHARSWLSSDITNLLDRYLGARWQNNPADQTVWQTINEVPDDELWRVHEVRRQKLIVWARRALTRQLIARGTDPDAARAAGDALRPNVLTMGFARRFATYKRAALLLRDVPRLVKHAERQGAANPIPGRRQEPSRGRRRQGPDPADSCILPAKKACTTA